MSGLPVGDAAALANHLAATPADTAAPPAEAEPLQQHVA